MSCLAALMQSCPNLQGDINQYWNTCNAAMAREQMPFTEFLASAVNRGPLIQSISPGQGKVRRVNVVYQKRILESEVAENQPNPNCSATSKRGQCLTEYEIDTTENVQAEEKVEVNDLADACVNNPAYFQSILERLIDAVDRKVATKSTTQAVGLYGTWGDAAAGVTPVNAFDELVVKTHKDSDETFLFPTTMTKITRSLEKIGYCAPFGVFGGDTLVDYYFALKNGCCQNTGQDLAKVFAQFGFAVAYDRRVAGSTGLGDNNKALIVMNGALQLLHYTASNWKDGSPAWVTTGSNYLGAVVVSPRLGIPYDLYVKDDCGVITITVTATTKVVGMPADMFATGDIFEGVRYVNKVLVTNI